MTAPPENADVETASDGYAKRFDSPTGKWMLERQLEVTRAILADLPHASVLDVGGGHGQVAPHLQSDGHPMTVLASRADAVNAVLRPSVEDGSVDLVVGELSDPPSGPKSFDVVLSYRLLAHANDLARLIRGMTSAARTAVVVDYATARSFNAVAEPLFNAKKKVESNTRPFAVHRDWDIVNLFEDQGFALTARRPQFFWPMALHRALKSPSLSRGIEGVAAALGLRALFGSPVIARFDRV